MTSTQTIPNQQQHHQPATFHLERPLDDYLQLSPLGLFPHARGLQQVDKEGLANLVKNFNSFLARLGRRFAGLPFYIGHPDVSGFENTYTDRKAYGWIMDLQVRDDGLYAKTKWTDAGRELISRGHYKFLSPTWTAEHAGSQNGRPVYRPTHLVSVGLTNEPNLPVSPFANTADPEGTATLQGDPLPLPEFSSAPPPPPFAQRTSNIGPQTSGGVGNANLTPAAPTPINPAPEPPPSPVATPPMASLSDEPTSSSASGDSPQIRNPQSALRNPESFPNPQSLPPPQPELHNSSASPDRLLALERRLNSMEQNLVNCQRELAAVQQRLIANVLDNAIASARILPIERKLWQSHLIDDFHSASTALANARPQLKTQITTDDLPRISNESSPGPSKDQTRREIRKLVSERMNKQGLNYRDAWSQVQKDRPELFAALSTPAL